jgi:phage shock protein E
MKLLSIAFVGLLVVAGCSSQSPVVSSIADPISTSEQIASDESEVFIIDVRSQAEWDAGHLNQAMHIPHTKIVDRIGEVTNDKNAQIVLYCAIGGRAGNAKEKLEQLGFTNVENGGGYEDIKLRYE